MNSSISSSEASAWRRFVLLLAGGAVSLLLGILAFVVVLDPYDTGRPAILAKSVIFTKPGVRPQGPRTANASRGRDPAFNAAILGNSNVQALRPDLIGAATGWSFVSLFVPAIKPRETLVLLDWFQRHQRGRDTALIIGVDGNWCAPDEDLAHDKPFPFWLYDASWPVYLRGLLRLDLLEESWRRLSYLVQRNPVRARPDGYWDNEADYIAVGYLSDPAKRAALHLPGRAGVPNLTGRFPAIDALSARLKAESDKNYVVLLRPPVFHTLLPAAGTEDARAFEACRAALSALADAAPGRALVDWMIPHPALREADMFFDRTHYRAPVARLVEAQIASVLERLKRPASR